MRSARHRTSMTFDRLRHAIAALLVAAWCALGTAHTAFVLAVRPHGLIVRTPPDAKRAIGIPDLNGATVTTLATLVDQAGLRPGDAVAVVPPRAADTATVQYIHQQLAHVLYPWAVHLITGSHVAAATRALLAPDGEAPGAGWRRVAERDGYALHVRRSP